MGAGEKREALRVPCSIPLRVYGQLRELVGRILDISRTGVRLRLPLTPLLGGRAAEFAEVAHAVEQVLGSSFLSDLHHEMLGQLVRKRLVPVRLGSIDVAEEQVDVGCRFEEPLKDEETMMLGVGLPPIGVTTAAAYRDVPPPARRGREQADRERRPRPRAYEGVLHPSPGVVAEPLAGRTNGMLEDRAALRVALDDIPGAFQVAAESIERALMELFGPAPRLEILDGLHMVWSGRVRITRVRVSRTEGGHADIQLQGLAAG